MINHTAIAAAHDAAAEAHEAAVTGDGTTEAATAATRAATETQRAAGVDRQWNAEWAERTAARAAGATDPGERARAHRGAAAWHQGAAAWHRREADGTHAAARLVPDAPLVGSRRMSEPRRRRST